MQAARCTRARYGCSGNGCIEADTLTLRQVKRLKRQKKTSKFRHIKFTQSSSSLLLASCVWRTRRRSCGRVRRHAHLDHILDRTGRVASADRRRDRAAGQVASDQRAAENVLIAQRAELRLLEPHVDAGLPSKIKNCNTYVSVNACREWI